MRTTRKILFCIQLVFLMSVCHMAVLDNFNYSSYGFWSSIVTSAISLLLIVWFSKKYQKDSFKYVDRPAQSWMMTIASAVSFIVAFMLFLPFGTSNPSSPGFYYCVALGIGAGLIFHFAFQKLSPRTKAS